MWGVPVCVRYGTADGSKVSCEMLDKAQGSMVLAGASQPTWVMPNANARAITVSAWARQNWPAWPMQIGRLGDAEQLAYADAVNAGFRHGDLDAGDALAALKPLTASKTARWRPRR